eukprot:gene18918-8848_t
MVSASSADESRSAMTQRAVDDLTRLFQPINLRPTFAVKASSSSSSSSSTSSTRGKTFGSAAQMPSMARRAAPSAAGSFGTASAGGFGTPAPSGASIFGSAPRYARAAPSSASFGSARPSDRSGFLSDTLGSASAAGQ